MLSLLRMLVLVLYEFVLEQKVFAAYDAHELQFLIVAVMPPTDVLPQARAARIDAFALRAWIRDRISRLCLFGVLVVPRQISVELVSSHRVQKQCLTMLEDC